MKNKKASQQFRIVSLILVIIFLSMMLFYSNNVLADASYQSSILECGNLFKNLDNSKAFFGEDLNKPSKKLFDAVSGICEAKDVEVSKKSVKNAGSLVNDCHRKTGEGLNIFNEIEEGVSVCVYCGLIKSDDEIDNFNELFSKELQREEYSFLKDSKEGETVKFDTLLVSDADGKNFQIGTPILEGTNVEAKIIEHGRGKKIRVFKMKPRKRYRKTQGHRQDYTLIEITSIGAKAKTAAKKPAVKKETTEKKAPAKKVAAKKPAAKSTSAKATADKKAE